MGRRWKCGECGFPLTSPAGGTTECPVCMRDVEVLPDGRDLPPPPLSPWRAWLERVAGWMESRTFRIGKWRGAAVLIEPALPLWASAFVLFGPVLRWAPDLRSALLQCLAFLGAVLLHGSARAWAAAKCGMPPAEIRIGLLGCVWRQGRPAACVREECQIACAGPLALLGGSIVAGMIAGESGSRFALWLCRANLCLLLLQMAPVFPMDGGRLFRALLQTLRDPANFTGFMRTSAVFSAVLLGLAGLLWMNPFLILAAWWFWKNAQVPVPPPAGTAGVLLPTPVLAPPPWASRLSWIPRRFWRMPLRLGVFGGVPVLVEPLVVGFCVVLQVVNLFRGALWAGLVSTGVLLASVLWHEAAHALAARRYGIPSREIWVGLLGGTTVLSAPARTPREEQTVAGAGLAASLALAGVAALWEWLAPGRPAGAGLAPMLLWTNLGLTFFQALPVLPLDGGRIFRAQHQALQSDAALLRIMRPVGFCAALLLGLVALCLGNLFLAAGACVVAAAARRDVPPFGTGG